MIVNRYFSLSFFKGQQYGYPPQPPSNAPYPQQPGTYPTGTYPGYNPSGYTPGTYQPPK